MRLGRWFDVEVSAHWSVLLLAFMSFSNVSDYFYRHDTVSEPSSIAIASILFSLGILLSILAHEFGHILVGRKYGVSFNSVVLHALGGAARMDGSIPTAKSEFLMAVAGPAVSVVLFVLLAISTLICMMLGSTSYLLITTLGMLSSTNLILGIFNLIPAYPLDGGRVLRAGIWAYTKNFLKATKIASVTGTAFGIVLVAAGCAMSLGIHIPFFGVGFGSGIWLSLIGFLIIMAANQELRHYQRTNLT